MLAMIRKQIQFNERQLKALRLEASRRGVSEAALVREAVDAWLARRPAEPDREALWDRAMSAIGIGHSGGGNIAVEHDRYLAERGQDH